MQKRLKHAAELLTMQDNKNPGTLDSKPVPRTVLIVDDITLIRRIVQIAMADEGYQTLEAEDGANAWIQKPFMVPEFLSEVQMAMMTPATAG